MLVRLIVRLLTFNPVLTILGRILAVSRELARLNGEDGEDTLTWIWYLFVMFASIGTGIWAARWYMHSIPSGDYSMGGMIFVLIDIFVFFIGFAVNATLMAKAAIVMKHGRPIVGLVATLFLFFALYLPIHRESLEKSRRLEEELQVARLANVENLHKQTERLPFVLPASAPEMLKIARDGEAYRIQNRSGGEVAVSVALVLFHDKLLDRCWARVDRAGCEVDSASCASQASSGVPGVPDPGLASIDTHPVLAAGEAKVFAISHCDPRYADGMLEYYVWSSSEQRFLFKSETALIQDYH